PVINKVDLPSAMPDRVKDDIENRIGVDCSEACDVSAKTGFGVPEVLEKIVRDIPAPKGKSDAPLKALIFDSYYDSYRGVVVLLRVFEGSVKPGDTIRLMQAGMEYQVTELGIRTPSEVKTKSLDAGEVGWLAAQIKDIRDVHPGETVTSASNPTPLPLPGYRKINPMVYCGLYPVDSKEYSSLKDALEKLSLNDASLVFEPETSQALGFGFRCGFLGLLHMDVVQERLEREYGLDLILTAPSVIYRVVKTNGEVIMIDNPSELPEPSKTAEIQEPFVTAQIMSPKEYVGAIMQLCQNRRGVFKDMQVFDDSRNILVYELPLSEIIYNFFDRLKSSTKGYASLDYEFLEYRKSELCKMDILLNGDVVDALSSIVYRPNAYSRGLALVSKLKTVIPRQQFEVPVQAAINGKVIARADIKSMRKDVLAKCYGGDISRKKKLLEKQKEGKKRMKAIGKVALPQEAFLSVLKID
ncbi:translation elongation factor 4, partial [Campylobacter sp.]|uniref:translation elongation factor 4 n=1 Tax=Campylobacter sp. TaxID=205 RepID=UPI002A5981B7